MSKRSDNCSTDYFSANLIKYRKRMGYTQKQLAEILGINRTTYTKYETGVCEPSVGMILAIVDALEIDVNTLFYDGRPLKNVGDCFMYATGDERALLLSLRDADPNERQKALRGVNKIISKSVNKPDGGEKK
ncbi:helix-turn-helix transcriptional regulator [Lachnoclostridium sp. MSJ-17]|uniref:helix-turn-helix transcriptional regulator n=1 Tax=Lachnoclostridium sp. MSJ-17 TaxID=2841516 RepID=UPI001C128CAB|nr:helix-turn-helix transcriptional regulator [Lachnoclostridium sp. MSJ-17]MBU5461161.1 helix-turn-helix domain-containing protein [Lachnoclostridium sp. MSJ-17]